MGMGRTRSQRPWINARPVAALDKPTRHADRRPTRLEGGQGVGSVLAGDGILLRGIVV